MTKDTLIKILKSLDINELTQPSNVRYGQAIYERGGVEIISHRTDLVEAWVGGLDGTVVEGGSQKRRTRLFVSDSKLEWHCAESAKEDQPFCKHCVALTMAAINSK